MALFHLSVTQTKRCAGQSAIASAAYRARSDCIASITANLATTPAKRRRRSAPTFSCRPCTANAQTARPYGTPWKIKKAERGKNAQLHTA